MLICLSSLLCKLGEMSMCLAYIDPGSGALLWQMIMAFAIGTLFYIKKFRRFLVVLVRRILRRD
jgi:hypothetical protein